MVYWGRRGTGWISCSPNCMDLGSARSPTYTHICGTGTLLSMGTGSVSSLHPQYPSQPWSRGETHYFCAGHILPKRLGAGATPQHPGPQQLLGNSSASGMCLPRFHNPWPLGLKCPLCLISEEGGGAEWEREDKQTEKNSESVEKAPLRQLLGSRMHWDRPPEARLQPPVQQLVSHSRGHSWACQNQIQPRVCGKGGGGPTLETRGKSGWSASKTWHCPTGAHRVGTCPALICLQRLGPSGYDGWSPH